MDAEIVKSAIQYICNKDEEFAKKLREDGMAHAVYGMLKDGGFDLQGLHKDGSLRRILNVFI